MAILVISGAKEDFYALIVHETSRIVAVPGWSFSSVAAHLYMRCPLQTDGTWWHVHFDTLVSQLVSKYRPVFEPNQSEYVSDFPCLMEVCARCYG
jgi:hypothetical protein